MAVSDYKKAIELAKARVIGVSLKVFQEIAVNAGGVAIDATPVLSGHLVSNWKLTANAPNTEEDNVFAPVRAAAKLRALVAAQNIKLGDTVFFTNPTHYGPFIEFGTSRIQPRMMSALAVAAIPQIVERAREKHKNG